MCFVCFLDGLNRRQEATLVYTNYAGKNNLVEIKIEIINGSVYAGDAYIFLRKNGEEWSSPIETDNIMKDIEWMQLYTAYVDQLNPKVMNWLVNNGPLPIREN